MDHDTPVVFRLFTIYRPSSIYVRPISIYVAKLRSDVRYRVDSDSPRVVQEHSTIRSMSIYKERCIT